MGLSLVAPLEVRHDGELASIANPANLAKRLILGKSTLDAGFLGYRYPIPIAAWRG
jgi:hypothetical protein